ncbi:MAG: alkylated DNA repair dioxygenase AlkB [Verrucomicrobiales bacterium]|jgi:alkylated DNA repair dioxygenase AlkB
MKLPLNCSVEYIPDFLDRQSAEELYRELIEHYHLDKERIVIEAGGQLITTDSFKILFSTAELIRQDKHPEHIHGRAHVWSGAMADLREKVERLLSNKFEIAMCLFYPDGNYFAPYHSDQETSGERTILPSISLGEERDFNFRDKSSGEVYSLELGNGSMLVMGEWCQSRYEHTLPKIPRYEHGRINITFREPSFQ